MRMLLVVLFLVSCYTTRSLDDLVRETKIVRSETEKNFESLSEDKAIELALLNNPEILFEKYRMEEARGELATSQRWRNPELRFSNTWLKRGNDRVDEDQDRISLEIRFRPPRPIEQSAKIESAKAKLKEASISIKEEEMKIRARVRVAYYSAVLALSRVELLTKLVELRSKRVYSAEEAMKKGGIDIIKFSDIRLELLKATSELEKAKTEKEKVFDVLTSMVGVKIESVEKKEPPCQSPPVLAENEYLDHPSIQRARFRFERAEHLVRAEYAAIIPWFNYIDVGYQFGVLLGLRSRIPGLEPNDRYVRRGFVVGFGIDIPIFDWNKGEITRAEAQRDQEAMRYLQTVSEVRKNANASLFLWRQAYETYQRVKDEGRAVVRDLATAVRNANSQGGISDIDYLRILEKEIEIEKMILEAQLECFKASQEYEISEKIRL